MRYCVVKKTHVERVTIFLEENMASKCQSCGLIKADSYVIIKSTSPNTILDDIEHDGICVKCLKRAKYFSALKFFRTLKKAEEYYKTLEVVINL